MRRLIAIFISGCVAAFVTAPHAQEPPPLRLAIAGLGGKELRLRRPKEAERAVVPEPLPVDQQDPITHLAAVVRGRQKPNALSSLENNIIVTEIRRAFLRRGEVRDRSQVFANPRSPYDVACATCTSSSRCSSSR